MSKLNLEAVAQNLRVERELLDVAKLLSGVEFVVFKGPFLTRRLYGELASRTSSDNDILVRRADGPRVLEILLDEGFVPILSGIEPRAALMRAGQVALHVPGDASRPSLDLHVRAFSEKFFDIEEEFVWNHTIERSFHGQSFRTFDDELVFCHLVAHYLQHLLEPPLLEDLRAGVTAIVPELDPGRLERVVSQTVGVLAADFACEMAGVAWRKEPSAVAAVFAACLRGMPRLPRSSVARGAIVVAMGSPRKIPGALAEGFFPSRDELVARYGEKSRSRLHFEHWLHRFGLDRSPRA